MKRKFLINLVVGVVITLLASSCFLTGEQSKDNVQTYEEEMLLLGEYLDSLVARGYDIDTTELGVYYITIDEGEGDYPQSGDKLEVIYSGYLMNGYMFDSSELSTSTGSWEFEFGNPAMIAGWDDGMKIINKGAKVQLIIPSPLAYGILGKGPIPPNNTVIFVIKMVNITPA